MESTCISLVKALKDNVYDGDGRALMNEFSALTDEDKDDLVTYFNDEGFNVERVKA